jgi:Lrp/AsnC family leucine-responsive transcriptional regulator
MIDGIDRQISLIVQENARISNTDIARQVGMAPSATLERLRKLESQGVIDGYRAHLNPKALGLDLLAFVFIRANESVARSGEVGRDLARIPEVQEVHHVAGEDCYLVKVRTANTESLGLLLRERIGAIESVTSTRTTIVLSTVKETTDLPIPDIDDER